MEAQEILEKLINRTDLTKLQSTILAEIIFSEDVQASIKAALLTALRMKGESVSEILGFIEIIRKAMVKVKIDDLAIDTCGNGGDNQNTFNISTAAAIVAAACGVKVAKHGNRNISSKSGSADVLEAMGARVDLTAKEVEDSLNFSNFTFMFVPNFHPIFKNIGLLRRELRIKTIFNLLGPLVNPAGVKRQIIGSGSREAAEILSKVVQRLDNEHILVVHSFEGMDEISIYEPTQVFEIRGNRIKKFVIKPEEFGLRGKDANNIRVNSIEESKVKLTEILEGSFGDARKIVLFNSAAALYVGGRCRSIAEGIKFAEKAIDEGLAYAELNKFIEFSKKVRMQNDQHI
ncbi:anthranilate phosphoribosyltransferase [Candidatus Gottesmanbacteria bacterium RIFCSPHIGHO2_02_FULL_39_14]|uniref:Anthranilate phosphoribosyltransferase n=2 Tax=Candidatus Gottesmaniibacteriota TaxID=1752720 RepID=A0A1F6A362_9BACT|nr:MAG: anthranilate phosphoribosyltransferase [Candidatus Gottesmanbacteria bacterium RBG_16_38_7b]OGG19105.1 MAG: anthranilate phosphoribosyltransferase [Candidatus Gottesmanbacteria bacterium RIFCSPHIGHO2_02_FULL_39_14]